MAGKSTKIKSLSGTSVASLDLTNCFNERYNIYEVFTTVKKTSGGSATNMKQRFLDSSGSAITSSDYSEGTWRNSMNSGAYDRIYSTTRDYMNDCAMYDNDSVASIRGIQTYSATGNIDIDIVVFGYKAT